MHSIHYLKFYIKLSASIYLLSVSFQIEHIFHLICRINFGYVSDSGEQINTSKQILVVEFSGSLLMLGHVLFYLVLVSTARVLN